MAKQSNIEWTEATWNPWHGCHKVSAGCKNCYMFRDKKHYGQDPNTVVRSKTKFYDPLKWTEPQTIFTCSWSDFFIEEADPWRDEAFEIIAKTPQHTYQILTKRPDRMLDYISRSAYLTNAPLNNVWLGVSVEDQKTADERIPLLLQTPAAVRFLSVEPLLGPLDLSHYLAYDEENGDGEFLETNGWAYDSWSGGFMGPNTHNDPTYAPEPGIHWVIAGGESGPDARPMHPDWARSIRDQCQAANVPFFFKQWGEWWPISQMPDGYIDDHREKDPKKITVLQLNGEQRLFFPPGAMTCFKVGKKKAGRDLDGRTWDEMPEVSNAH